jgi:acetyl-CoA C-acetyltransferase
MATEVRPRNSVQVLGYARTPFGRFGGSLRATSLLDLGAHAVTAALERAAVDPAAADELVFGVNFPGSDRSIARQIQLRSGIPPDRVSYTVDRACCSSLAAITLASRSLRLGESSIAVAGGAENLSRVPYFIESARFGQRLGDIVLADQLVISCQHTGIPRAVQASVEAAAYGIDRAQQDEWAHRSQEAYARAQQSGFFADEIAPIEIEERPGLPSTMSDDEPPRPRTTLEGLAKLQTIYGSDTVTAGNAPDLSSGASALVLAHDSVERGSNPPAILFGWSMASGDPQHIASMPAVAAQLALTRTGLALHDVDVLEINEAFAAVPLVSTLLLAGSDAAELHQLRQRTNVNGGAVAVGHPTGATGARLVMTTINELTRRGGGTGLVTMCGGIGEAEAVVVRVGVDQP